MKATLILLPALILAVQGCACARKNLGHGYSIINCTEEMRGVPGAFESKSHHRDLYYQSLKLGTVGQYSVAPSGRFALFESNGKLLLFTSEAQQLRDETPEKFSIPKTIEWRENAGVVVVTFFDDSVVRTIQLCEQK